MPDDILQDALEDNNVIRDAIDDLKKMKGNFIEKAFSKILISNPRYLRRIKDKEYFKDSVIQHINWILADMYNPGKINFEKYNVSSLKDTPQAYCDIYKYIIELTNDIDIEIKEIWHDYFNALREMYSCRN